MTTFADLVQKVIRRLSIVPGTSVQVYAEERIGLMLEHTYDVTVEEVWWPDLMRWAMPVLGNTGLIAVNVPGLLTARDIRYVYYQNNPRPLPVFVDRMNPTTLAQTGQAPQYWEPSPTETIPIRVLPYGSPGDVLAVRYRRRTPKPFLPTTNIVLDEQLMILGATYDFLEDDGTSPGAAAKFAEYYNARLQQLKAKWNEGEIYVGTAPSDAPDGWQEL